MSRWTAVALAALAGAVGCAVVAIVQLSGHAGCGVEGAYFDRTEGAPEYAGVFESGCDEFSASNPYLWSGAAIAFAVMLLAILAASRLRRRAA